MDNTVISALLLQHIENRTEDNSFKANIYQCDGGINTKLQTLKYVDCMQRRNMRFNWDMISWRRKREYKLNNLTRVFDCCVDRKVYVRDGWCIIFLIWNTIFILLWNRTWLRKINFEDRILLTSIRFTAVAWEDQKNVEFYTSWIWTIIYESVYFASSIQVYLWYVRNRRKSSFNLSDERKDI